MKRTFVLCGCLVLMSVLFLTGCGEKEPLRIGFAGTLTGNNSAVAVSGRDAVQMAIDEVNASGGLLGRRVVLISKDDQNTLEQTKAVDEAFIKEGVTVVIGHMMSGVAPAMMEAIKDQPILIIAPTMSTITLSDLDDNFLRTTLTNYDQGRSLSTYIREKGKYERLMVLYSDTNQTFIEGMRAAVIETFEALGGEVVHTAVIREKNMIDVKAAVMAGIEKKADAVALLMNAGDVAMFAQIREKEGGTYALFSGTWGLTSDLIRMGGKTVEGIIGPNEYDPDSTSEAYVEFVQRYKESFGSTPDFGAVLSYDTAKIVMAGIQKAGSMDPIKVKAAILEIGTFQGLQKPYVINATGDVEGSHFMFVLKDGVFVNVENVK